MKILTDLHTHTTVSAHAYSTLTENAAAAAAKGLEAIAMTNHAGTIPDAAHMWHFLNLKAVPRYIHGVRILRGAEVNITDICGTVDMPEDIMQTLDIVIASIHRPCYADLDKADHTEAYMAVVENPYVDIIGHSGSKGLEYNYDAVIKRAAELGKMIEINAGTCRGRRSSLPNCHKIAETCKRLGANICINSDSHYFDTIGCYDEVFKMLDEIDFPEELVANRTLGTLAELLAGRKEIEI